MKLWWERNEMLCSRCFCFYSRSPPTSIINNKKYLLLFKTKLLFCSPKHFPSKFAVSHSHSHMMEDKDHASSSSLLDFLSQKSYTPPFWASHLTPIPSHVFSLAHLPTPIHKWNLLNLPKNTEVWLKVSNH